MTDAKNCEQYSSDNSCCTCRNRAWHSLAQEMRALFHKTGTVPTLLGFTIDDIANLVKENNTLKQYKKSKQASYEEIQKRWQEAEKYSRKLENELSEAKKMLEFYQGCFAGKGGR